MNKVARSVAGIKAVADYLGYPIDLSAVMCAGNECPVHTVTSEGELEAEAGRAFAESRAHIVEVKHHE